MLIHRIKNTVSSFVDYLIIDYRALTKEAAVLFICAVFALLSWFIFNERTQFITTIGNWYSEDVNYQYQVLSLWKGKLALLDTPEGIQLDWVWGPTGAQQVWGLGVPIILFISSLCGAIFPVPDRLIFTALWIVIGTFLVRSFYRKECTTGVILILLTALLSPMVAPAQTRLWVYELAVLWGALLTLATIAILVHTVERNFPIKWLCILGVVSGYLPLIRPTLICYTSVIGIILILESMRQKKARIVISYVVTALIGTVVLLLTNEARFGSPLEFGHHVNVFGDEYVRFVTKWPVVEIRQIRRTFFDLLEGLLLYDTHRHVHYTNEIYKYDFPRAKELYFRVVSKIDLLGAILMIPIIIKSARNSVRMLAIVAISSFLLLALFYLIYQVFSSRYLVDLTPCIILIYWAFTIEISSHRHKYYYYGAMVCLLAISIWTFRADPATHGQWHPPINPLTHVLVTPELNKLAFVPPTKKVVCPNDEIFHTFVSLEKELGWDFRNTCSVNIAMNFIMESGRCVTLRGRFHNPDAVAVKAGLIALEKVSQTDREIRFCGKIPQQTYTTYFIKFALDPNSKKVTDYLYELETSDGGL